MNTARHITEVGSGDDVCPGPTEKVPVFIAVLSGCLLASVGLFCAAGTLKVVQDYLGVTLGTPTVLLLQLTGLSLVALGTVLLRFRGRAVLQSVGLFTMSILAGLAIGEGYVRTTPEGQRLLVSDTLVHHAFKPLRAGMYRWGPRETYVYTNSLGFRDHSRREVEQDPEHFRILFVGDSFVEGVGVDYESTVVSRVGKSLNSRGTTVDVLNAGVSGYSPRLSLRSLQRFFELGFKADVVILSLDISDLVNEGIDYRDWHGYSRTRVQVLNLLRFLKPRLPRFVLSRSSALVDGSSASQRLARRLERTDSLYADTWPKWKSRGLATCGLSIVSMDSLSQANGADFGFFIFPHPQHLENADAEWYRTHFSRFSDDRDLWFGDLFPVFSDSSAHHLFIRGDIHWNEHGHEAAAKWLVEWILKEVGSVETKANMGSPTL